MWNVEWSVELSQARNLYLTKTKHGIWYYQRWLPISISRYQPQQKALFRVSLRTKTKGVASQLSQLLSVHFDSIIQKHVGYPEKLIDALDALRSNVAKGGLQPIPSMADRFMFHDVDGYQDAILAELQKFRDESNKLLTKLSELVDAVSIENQNTVCPTISDDDNPTVSKLFTDWVDESTMRKNSLDSTYKPAIDLFIRLVNHLHEGEARINDIGINDARQYRSFIKSLPLGAKTVDVPIPDLITLSNRKKTRGQKSTTTINGIYANVGTFLRWIRSEGYPLQPDLYEVITKPVKAKTCDRKVRVPFADHDLKALFCSQQYMIKGRFKTSGMYWAPLIALFTGARMSEILQLEKPDIQRESGHWVFNINDHSLKSSDKHKHVKNIGSVRKIPIHASLINLGFIDYVASRKGAIFPDEPRNTSGKFDAFQKRFATYRNNVGVVPKHKGEFRDFHSFRHTVETRLGELRATGSPSQRFDQGIIDAIIGHVSTDRGEGLKTYNHAQYIAAKANALNRLKYDSLQLDNILRWEDCRFF